MRLYFSNAISKIKIYFGLVGLALIVLLEGFAFDFNDVHKSKPNIVVIEIDDLGYGDVGSYNKEINFIPNIDKLAEEGI